MSLLTRYPALKAAIANQYQAILAAGAVGFSVLMLSPLPLLLFAGVELMVMPMMVDRIRRRLEIEKKYADRVSGHTNTPMPPKGRGATHAHD